MSPPRVFALAKEFCLPPRPLVIEAMSLCLWPREPCQSTPPQPLPRSPAPLLVPVDMPVTDLIEVLSRELVESMTLTLNEALLLTGTPFPKCDSVGIALSSLTSLSSTVPLVSDRGAGGPSVASGSGSACTAQNAIFPALSTR